MKKIKTSNNSEIELTNMKNKVNNDISIRFNGNGIPHIFFDYNIKNIKYNYVIYYFSDGRINYLVIKKIDKDGNISEVGISPQTGLFKVSDRIILLLCKELLLKYKGNNTEQMKNMYNLLKTYFLKLMTIRPDTFKNNRISSNTPYQKLANEIYSKFQSNQ